MLRRALLAVAVISYLTCVLYLSGLQKSDSNVNSLRKTQGRSVNIPKANNEKLHTEVLPNNSVANQIKINESQRRASAVDLPSKDLGKAENKNHNGSNLRDRRTVEVEENLEEASASNENENSEKLHIISADNHTKIIQYTQEKPNLRKVITFWQKLVSRNQETTTEKLTTNTTNVDTISNAVQTTTTNIKEANTTLKNNETEDLRKSRNLSANNTAYEDILRGDFEEIFSEYTSKETTRLQSSTTSTTKVKPSLDDDTDIFNDLINTADKSSEMHKFNAHMSKYSYEFKFAKFIRPIDNTQQENQNRKSIQRDKESQDMFVRDFNNLEQNVLNKPTTLQFSVSNEDDYVKYTTNNNKVDENVSAKPIYTELGVNNYVKTKSTPLPDVIKQLAENVKNLIIKDLGKRVTTTTEVTPASTRYFTGNKNYIVIEKIMEILQKYKTESNMDVAPTTEMATVTIPSTPRVVNRPKVNKKVPKKANNEPNHSYSKGYGNHKRIPVRNNIENLKSQPIFPVRYLPLRVSSNIANDLKIMRDSNSKSTQPITIQTNLLEIPPLGVPVPNPASIVSHNIIITTIRPYVQNIEDLLNDYDMLIKNHQTSNRIRLAPPINLFKNSNLKDAVCGERKKNKGKKINAHRMRDHDTIDNTDEVVIPMKKYKKNPTRYENVHGFHEKFENYQQSHGDIDDMFREDCSKDDIIPREPIKYIKRGNDAAFTKLLRSQQRVTEMLEQMLARSKNEDPVVVTT